MRIMPLAAAAFRNITFIVDALLHSFNYSTNHLDPVSSSCEPKIGNLPSHTVLRLSLRYLRLSGQMRSSRVELSYLGNRRYPCEATELDLAFTPHGDLS